MCVIRPTFYRITHPAFLIHSEENKLPLHAIMSFASSFYWNIHLPENLPQIFISRNLPRRRSSPCDLCGAQAPQLAHSLPPFASSDISNRCTCYPLHRQPPLLNQLLPDQKSHGMFSPWRESPMPSIPETCHRPINEFLARAAPEDGAFPGRDPSSPQALALAPPWPQLLSSIATQQQSPLPRAPSLQRSEDKQPYPQRSLNCHPDSSSATQLPFGAVTIQPPPKDRVVLVRSVDS